jgi:hypothetical protein
MAKRKSTQAKAEELWSKIEGAYWWDLTDFEKMVRNEFELQIAQAIMSEHPTDEAAYNEIVEWERDCRAAEDRINDCDETKHELAKNLTPEQVKEAELFAKLIWEI